MRCSSHLHNYNLLHWLIFVLAFDFRANALTTSAFEETMSSEFLFDATNLTKTTFADMEDTPIDSSSSLITDYETSASTPTSVVNSRASMTMTSHYIASSSSIDATSETDYIGSTVSSTSRTSNAREMKSQSITNSKITASPSLPASSNNFQLFKSTKRNFFEAKSLRSLGTDSTLGTLPTVQGERQRTFRSKHHHEQHWGPFFEEPHNSTSTGDNLVSTAHLFTEAVLNCRVGMLKDKTVMWLKKTADKVSLLTVGNVTYSGDPRIRVKFQYPNNWRLLINPTQKEDTGIYMCQVSTHPPRVFTTNLTILEPPLRLIDEQERDVGDRYYKAGSTIDLHCQVSRSFLLKEKQSILKSMQGFNNNQTKINNNKLNKAATGVGTAANELIISNNQTANLEKQFNSFILWAKDDLQLPPTAIRRMSSTDKWLHSRVSIPDANLLDSGNYSCAIGKVFTAIVQVQVLSDGVLAAVQHNTGNSILCHDCTKLLNFYIFAKIYLFPFFVVHCKFKTFLTFKS